MATIWDVYMTELINHEREKTGIQPHAIDENLGDAAADHNRWMLATDTFSHIGTGGSSPGDRVAGAGYIDARTWGENIARGATSTPESLKDEVEQLHAGLVASPSHYANITNPNFKEVGIDWEVGDFAGQQNAIVTQDYATNRDGPFIVGVAIRDRDGDRLYDPGEQIPDVTVTIQDQGGNVVRQTTTGGAGDYDVAVPANGTYDVVFSGAGIAPRTVEDVVVGGVNRKIDLINPSAATPTDWILAL